MQGIVLDSSDATNDKTEQVPTHGNSRFCGQWKTTNKKTNKSVITTCSKAFNGKELGVVIWRSTSSELSHQASLLSGANNNI